MNEQRRTRLKLTSWYPGFKKPLRSRPGWYDSARSNSVLLRIYWNGYDWSAAPGGHVFWHQDFAWRGVSR